MNDLTIKKTNLIITLHNGIAVALRRSVSDAIEIGRLLEEVKAELAHGEFLPWIEEELPFAERTAQNYMRLYRYRDKTANVADLREAYQKIEQLETVERQKKQAEQSNLINQYKETGEKPGGWGRDTQYQYEKQKEQEKFEERKEKIDAEKLRTAEEEERRAEEKAQEEVREKYGHFFDELGNLFGSFGRDDNLHLDDYKDDSEQTKIFRTLKAYIKSFPTVSRRLEVTQNLIRKLRAIGIELQRESVGG